MRTRTTTTTVPTTTTTTTASTTRTRTTTSWSSARLAPDPIVDQARRARSGGPFASEAVQLDFVDCGRVIARLTKRDARSGGCFVFALKDRSGAAADESVPVGERHSFGAAVNTEFQQDVLDVRSHRLAADEEVSCDFARGLPVRQQSKDLELPSRQVEGRGNRVSRAA